MTAPGAEGMARTVWFFADGDRAVGPISWDALLSAARRHELTAAGRVWSPGVEAWVSAREVPWLFGPPDEAPSGIAAEGGAIAVPPPLKGTRFARTRPASPLTRLGLEAARPWYRALAFLIDSGAVILLAAGLGPLLHWAMDRWGVIAPDVSANDLTGLSAAVLLILYSVGVDSYWGTSLGKRLTGCRLIDAYGDTPFATRIVIRSFVRAATAMGVLVMGIGIANGGIPRNDRDWWIMTAPLVLGTALSVWFRDRRTLHDLAGGTWVVRQRRAPRES